MEIENVRVMKSRLNVRMLESISLFSSSGKYPFEEFLRQRKPFDAAKNRLISCGGAKVYLNGTLGRVDFEFANDCAAWRAGAGIGKGLAMGAFGAAIFLATMLRAFEPGAPAAATMGVVGLLALVANVGCAAALFRYRGGDSNMRSVWLCSRNDGINNLAVLAAAGAVFVTASRWPDLLVGFGLALLELTTAWQSIRQATGELRQARPG